VISFDLTTGEPVSTFLAATDTLNGFQFHPYLPLAATASGMQSCTQCLSLPIACFLVFGPAESANAELFVRLVCVSGGRSSCHWSLV